MSAPNSAATPLKSLEHDRTVVTTQELIRIDTTNYGEGKSKGEREAAEYLEARLQALGLEVTMLESEPRRTSLVTRIHGKNPDKPALVLHGHTDVVPADPALWSVDPFAAEIREGMIWGRGAVDMKNMDAMILTAVEDLLGAGERPERDLIVAFFADEENGGPYGARYVVDNRPDLFAGATEAISEVGGYSITLGEKRAYLLQTGEKALMWIRLRCTKAAGHGSRVIPAEDNAISTLAAAVARLASHVWPVKLNDTTERMIAELADLLGLDPQVVGPNEVALATGKPSGLLTASLRTTTNPTMMEAGYKHNVIPETATVAVDVRPFPGEEAETIAKIQEIVGPEVEIEVSFQDAGTENPPFGTLFDAATQVIQAHDPGASVVPYFLSAGTDNKSLARLGIAGYGFAPLKLPAELDFPGMFHGIDERVPLDALVFGREVLKDLLRTY